MGDSSISTFLHQAKYIVDKLTTVGHPISLISFNATIFNNLDDKNSEMVASFVGRECKIGGDIAEIGVQRCMIEDQMQLKTVGQSTGGSTDHA